MIRLVKTVRTSVACPSQWDAWDEDGNYYYLRYRHGCGAMRQYRTPEWHLSDDDQLIAEIGSFEAGDPLDGVISLEEFLARIDGAELAGRACPLGLTETEVMEMMGDRLPDFLRWMGGQTVAVCDGRAWDYAEGEYLPTACADGPHGPVVYPWDAERFLDGLPAAD